ncbi:MAG: VPLPA-CTERM sorting domain-containing protein [Paracoccus sp. (in: a-proteobacteria)]|nr:VPLPA-CTERM sorting domain-containing protein [Paracoccus sp. (in: a-proteobacteria)]
MTHETPPADAAVIAALLFVTGSGALSAASLRADQILDRFRNANGWRDHIMVVGRRGAAFREKADAVARNSRASLDRAVRLGVDMVEIDVRKTLDGVFVVSPYVDVPAPAPVPLPAAGWALLAALGGFAVLRRRAA